MTKRRKRRHLHCFNFTVSHFIILLSDTCTEEKTLKSTADVLKAYRKTVSSASLFSIYCLLTPLLCVNKHMWTTVILSYLHNIRKHKHHKYTICTSKYCALFFRTFLTVVFCHYSSSRVMKYSEKAFLQIRINLRHWLHCHFSLRVSRTKIENIQR